MRAAWLARAYRARADHEAGDMLVHVADHEVHLATVHDREHVERRVFEVGHEPRLASPAASRPSPPPRAACAPGGPRSPITRAQAGPDLVGRPRAVGERRAGLCADLPQQAHGVRRDGLVPQVRRQHHAAHRAGHAGLAHATRHLQRSGPLSAARSAAPAAQQDRGGMTASPGELTLRED